jgi:hypothetical protein
MRSPAFRPRVEPLETRDTPSVLFTESFESPPVPATPAGWSAWSSNGNGYITSRLAASTGTASLASLGTTATTSRFYQAAPQPADNAVSVRVRTDGPAPTQVIARGQNLGTAAASYLAAAVSPGGRRVDLVEVTGGTTRTLATLPSAAPTFGSWVELTLVPAGNGARVKLKRLDNGQYLNAQGVWQAGETEALRATVTLNPPAGQVGVGRAPGGQGMQFLDDFTVSTPDPVRQSFDTTVAGLRPDDWRGWTADGTAGFVASSARALSPANGYSANGTSVTAARSWLATPQPADVRASASLYADSLIPASLLVRGANLDTSTPTFYALTVTRGLEAQLIRVVNGVGTTLASVKSDTYTSSVWLRLTLTATGNTLRAVVSRADTGQWLSPDGTWEDDPQPAIEVVDPSIASGGLVGLARARLAAGAVTFDDVEVKPASSAVGPRFTLTASQPNGTFTGDVTFRVTGNASAPPRRIEFRLDGVLRSASAASSADWTLDTTLLANGAHQLVVRAADEVGEVSTTTLTFTTANANPTPPPVRPDLPRHYSHIRIAQLAYSNTPLGSFELTKLRDSVDLAIPSTAFLGAINQEAPNTPQLVYSNLSNVYLELLPDWLSYADRTGTARELAFYHVNRATPFTGSSAGARPVTEFWAAYRGPAATPAVGQADVTGNARGGTAALGFGAAGQAVAFGYVEKFREMNFTLTRGAAAGWQGVFEYPNAVAADGTPTAWKTLTLISDGTTGMTKSGRVTFDPPADWVPAAMAGSGTRYFYVRVRPIAGTATAAPEAKTVLGRDYVGANGTKSGTIPAFDYAADKNGDGYLTDAEYGTRAPGKDARFVYETRLFYPTYGQMRFATNPADPAVRRWAADYHKRVLQATPLADGFFLDNSNGRLPVSGLPVIEPTTNYGDDFAAMVAGVWRAVAPKIVVSNTAGGWDSSDPVVRASTGVLEEYLLRATDANWANVTDVSELVQSRLASDSPSPYVILDTHPGSFATTDPRLRAATLAYYYLVADPDRTMLMFFGGDNPSAAWSSTWIPSATVDVGRPAGTMTTFAMGSDPENRSLTYKVFRRDYGKAVVLYKPRSYALGVGTGTLNNATATTHQLGGSYRVLNPDGTLGPVVTSVTLRNGEGVVLMKV